MDECGKPRHLSVNQALGGGAVADALLWENWHASVLVLFSATSLWFLFERAGYNLLSFTANVFLLLVVILFLWAKSASLLNRPLPPIRDLEISEETVQKAADEIRVWVNRVLSIAREIAIGGNLRVLLQVIIILWMISYVGSLCNLLTLIYLGILLSFSVPVLYDKYWDQIDAKLFPSGGKRRRFHKTNVSPMLELFAEFICSLFISKLFIFTNLRGEKSVLQMFES
ncbi:hypothetical protein Nepgr_018132 [Nepenthes gracilis]|uniref:Reticulon-like protein n=1 Tax=Nepenthes gracilis TaxID=150966 RepID=A0AAD3XU11_NEPGR|nr:hypothetical protein Nepgr_018132 [Nepenthes gracilis]